MIRTWHGPKSLGQMQGIHQGRPMLGWIPFDENQFGSQPVPFGLRDPPVDKCLHAPQQVAAMVVIPSGNYD